MVRLSKHLLNECIDSETDRSVHRKLTSLGYIYLSYYEPVNKSDEPSVTAPVTSTQGGPEHQRRLPNQGYIWIGSYRVAGAHLAHRGEEIPGAEQRIQKEMGLGVLQCGYRTGMRGPGGGIWGRADEKSLTT